MLFIFIFRLLRMFQCILMRSQMLIDSDLPRDEFVCSIRAAKKDGTDVHMFIYDRITFIELT